MSQLGWIGTRNKKAEKLLELCGNPRKHLEVLKTASDKYPCGGEPSFQNALETALSSLRHMPNHTSREVLLIHGSLTTCDPGDINTTIQVRTCFINFIELSFNFLSFYTGIENPKR